MAEEFIKIRGCRVHNLKNIDVDIPRDKLVVLTGISGSGKSSLAFDTIYAEGQRRYVESLSAYARQFLGVMQKPDADKIEGISPAIAIDQRSISRNPRSTVGTITEIYDYLRLLFARIGKPHCPQCGDLVSKQSVEQIVNHILELPAGEIVILGPVIRDRKGEHKGVLEEIKRAGFARARFDGIVYSTDEALELFVDKKKKHNVDVVVDRIIQAQNSKRKAQSHSSKLKSNELDDEKMRIMDSVETALKIGKGLVIVAFSISHSAETRRKAASGKQQDLLFSERFACEKCGINLPEIEPRIFSFNSPYGACNACTGLGSKLEVDPNFVMPNKNLTIAEGAIRPWMFASHRLGRQNWYWSRLAGLADKYNFSLNIPVKDLSQKIIDLILYGDIASSKSAVSGLRSAVSNSSFEGVIPNLERRYRETDSDWTRQEIERYMIIKKCDVCQGKRLKPEALAVTVAGISIDKITDMSIAYLQDLFAEFLGKNQKSKIKNQKYISKIKNFELTNGEFKIAEPIVREILNRLQFLIDVGLDYLMLDRGSMTLAGGEAQRIQLATQIGSKLTGVTYILDEPSIGLHPRDQARLIETIKKLRDLKNTLIVVEHDPQTILAADWIIDIGPGAGKHGGKVIFQGTPKELLRSKTLTGEYISGIRKVEVMRTSKLKTKNQKLKTTISFSAKNTEDKQNYLMIKGATEHNLKNIDVKIPLGKLVCVTGVSGSGKSTLINDILARALLKKFYNAKEEPGAHQEILGAEFLTKAVLVDQSPIGRTPRSNPATYTGVFSFIRDIFSKTKESRIRGYGPGRFSFNVKGGRCEACEGQGSKKIEMYFLPDVYVECEECRGARYNSEALQVEYKGKNISEVLNMTVEEAFEFFNDIPAIEAKLRTLNEVGLGYIELGQPAPSLSGGEAQRVKLAAELSRRESGKSLYVLDEPTTGLHFDDIKKLLTILSGLVMKGNTVLVIEHNVDIIRNADWIIDLGPEGGAKGGEIVAEGTPKELVKNQKSHTARYLK